MSIHADVPHDAEIAFGEGAKRNHRLGAHDPGTRRNLLGDEIAQLIVLADARDDQQIVGPGHAVHFGHARDREQLVGQRLDASGFDVEQHECGDHGID
jgi:hypothetical protein